MNQENNLGKKIRELRIAHGYTQEQLAEKVGIDNKHLSKIEKGIHIPSYKTILKLTNILNFTVETISNEKEIVEQNPIIIKSLKILNSAKSDEERNYYLSVLKLAQKGLSISNKD